MKKYLLRLLPFSFKQSIKNIYSFPKDSLYRIRSRNRLIPPPSTWASIGGPGWFVEIGQEFRCYLIVLAKLKPYNRVLDVGCGNGRMAIPLTNYLSKEGEYYGFDIIKKGIDWCQKRITTKFNNFHFQQSDVYNRYYNKKGLIQAKDYKFNFETQYFDVVFLTSVFTHMVTLDVENYLSEISRVLKTGGKCLITFYILNEESERLMRSGRSVHDLKHKIDDNCFTSRKEIEEACIGYKEDYIKELFLENGLKIIQPVQYGNWCERDDYLSSQDIVVAIKE